MLNEPLNEWHYVLDIYTCRPIMRCSKVPLWYLLQLNREYEDTFLQPIAGQHV